VFILLVGVASVKNRLNEPPLMTHYLKCSAQGSPI
jgi:hypothetical protein